MLAHNWYASSVQIAALAGRNSSVQDEDDEILDDWLASMSVSQFERILNLLMDRRGDARSPLDRPA